MLKKQEMLKEYLLMNETERENKPPLNINIPIEWHVPENLRGQYASNVFMQAGEYEVFIYFFQTQLPLLVGTPEENKAKLEQLQSVRADCVAKLIVNPDLVPKIISTLQAGWDAYQTQKAILEEGNR